MGRLLVVVSLVLTASVSLEAETLKVLALQSESFFYEKDGKPTGIEHDILEYFAKSTNATLEIEWVSSFPSLLERIGKGEGDLAAGTITITPERTQRLDFSLPYFPVQVALVEPIDAKTQSLEELTGTKVGAFAGTTAEDALRAVPGIRIVSQGTLREMMVAIDRGELRAAAADSSAIIPVLEEFPSLKMGLLLGEPQGFGFAFVKGSPLKSRVNGTIRKLKESGIYFRLVTEHMGPRASDIVKAVRVQ